MKGTSSLILKYIRGQSSRSLLALAGLVMAVALVCSTSIIGASLTASYLDYVVEVNGSWHAAYSELNETQVAVLLNHAYAEQAGLIRDHGVCRLDRGLAIVAAEYDQAALELNNIRLLEGELPRKSKEIALEDWILTELGLDTVIGGEIILAFGQEPETAYILRGILDSQSNSQISGYAVGVLGGGAQGQPRVVIRFKEKYASRNTGEAILAELGLEHSQVRFNNMLLLALGSTGPSKAYLIFSVAVLAATVAVIHNVFHISVLERIKQYGMLRALGTGPKQIRRMVVGEGLLLAAAAIPLGLCLGLVGAFGMTALFSSTFAQDITRLVFPWWSLVGASSVCLVAILISSWLPVRLACTVSPMEAMRGQGAVMIQDVPVRKWHMLLGKVFGVSGIMAWRNLQRHRRQFLVTVLSMTICVALVIAFGYYVGAAQPDLILKDQFPAEFILSVSGINQAVGYTQEDLDAVRHLNGVEDVFAVREHIINLTMPAEKLTDQYRNYVTKRIKGSLPLSGSYSSSSGLYGYSTGILQEAERLLSAGRIDAEKLAAGSEVLLVNHLHLDGGLSVTTLEVGDEVVLRVSKLDGNQVVLGPEQSFRIAGILTDYPLPADIISIGPGIVMHEDAHAEFTGSAVCRRVFILPGEEADRDYLKTALRSLADNTYQGRLISYHEQIEEMEAQKRQYSIFLISLIAVVVLISLFSIVNTISTNLLLRTRELGVLRAVGMSSKQLAATMRVECIYYGLTSAVTGAVVGNLLAWAVFTVAGKQATWLEWSLPWQATLLACTGAISTALLSAIGPIRRMSRMDVVDVIRRVY